VASQSGVLKTSEAKEMSYDILDAQAQRDAFQRIET
jgi:hypothetical protein